MRYVGEDWLYIYSYMSRFGENVVDSIVGSPAVLCFMSMCVFVYVCVPAQGLQMEIRRWHPISLEINVFAHSP